MPLFPSRSAAAREVSASLVVFLVALPLCVGVAVASGVPAELGLVTGIVGGLLTGLLPGSSLQVSGPAAGLTVLVFEAVQDYGLKALGALVLCAGAVQLVLGLLRFGRWFRAMSVAVVQGMLGGIGLVLIAGQVYALADMKAHGNGPANLAGLPELLTAPAGRPGALTALLVGTGTVAVLVVWKRMPSPVRRLVPGPLAAVGLATAAVWAFGLPVERVRVSGLFAALRAPGASGFAEVLSIGGLGTVLAFALIASAESLFSAAAVDRLHDGPRTDYDKELIAQGVGNLVCGALGALPMTAVIVRSAANVQAGARTKASRVLHGVWLLLFAALLPAALGVIPLAALAGVLVHAGAKLLPTRAFAAMWRTHRADAVLLAVTSLAIVATNLFEGVLLGLVLALVKSAWETSRIHIETRIRPASRPGPATVQVTVSGHATFLRLPRLLDTLEALPADRPVELDLSRLLHLDHACGAALTAWADRHNAAATTPVRMTLPRVPAGEDVPDAA